VPTKRTRPLSYFLAIEKKKLQAKKIYEIADAEAGKFESLRSLHFTPAAGRDKNRIYPYHYPI